MNPDILIATAAGLGYAACFCVTGVLFMLNPMLEDRKS